MVNAWYDIFNSTRMVFFLVGMSLATGWHYFKLKAKGIVLDLSPLGIIAGVAVIVFLAIQQVGLATEMKRCQAEFNTVLQERARLSDASDVLSGELIEANSKWLTRIANPPPEIADLHTTDPVYRTWVKSTLHDYLTELGKIRDERTQALEARREKIYPTPTCGK